jgi:chorismate dehydratase
MLDLGEAWTEWTGLPFAYAVWQARRETDASALRRLHGILLDSLSSFRENDTDLATRHAPRYGLEPARLREYWRSLRYTLDDRMEQGLMRFYELAAALGEAPPVTALHWFDEGHTAT